LAGRIAANSPVGLRAAKRALRLGHGLDLRAGLEVEDAAWRSVAFSADRAEGVAAFQRKRRLSAGLAGGAELGGCALRPPDSYVGCAWVGLLAQFPAPLKAKNRGRARSVRGAGN